MSPTIAPIEDRRSLGIGLVVLAQVFFAVLDTSAKWLSVAGIPVFEVVFVRYLVPVVVLLAILLPGQGLVVFRTRNLKLEVLRGLCLAGVTAAMFYALKFLPLTVTGSLLFTMPLIVCALSAPLLGESVGWRRWVAIGVGFCGILIIVRPGTEAFHPAALLCLLSALLAALYSITTRKLAGVDSPSTQTMYGALTSLICVTPFAFNGWVWPSEPATWTAFLLVGLSGLAAHQLITVAHRFAPPSTLAPFSYVELIYLAIASWLIFSQPPDIWFYAGAPLIIGSGLFIWLRERAHRQPAAFATIVED
jgi:drug/metabolite transporter (DMT)-like permease